MQKNLLFLALLISSTVLFAQSPKFDWVTQEGNGSEDFGWKIKKASNGDLYVVIGFQGSTTVGGISYTQGATMNYDFLICKYSSSGIYQWAKQLYENTGNADFPLIEVDGSDNLYLISSYSNTIHFDGSSYSPDLGHQARGIFGAKISNSGNVVWAKNLVTTYSIQGNASMDLHSSGTMILTAPMKDSIKIGTSSSVYVNGNLKVFFTEFNSNGTSSWSSIDPAYKYIKYIKYDSNSSDFYVAGNFTDSTTFTGSTSVAITSNGSSDAFLAKYNNGIGSCYWANSIGSSSSDDCHGLVISNSNSYLIVSISATANIFGNNVIVGAIPKLVSTSFNTSGSAIFAVPFATVSSFLFQGFSKDNVGNLYLSGSFSDSISFTSSVYYSGSGKDALLIKLKTSDGSYVWAKSWGGIGDDIVRATASNDNEVYCVGKFTGVTSFGIFQYTANGSCDPFIAKLSGCDMPSVYVSNSGSPTLCNGQAIILGATNLSGASYQWLSNNSPVPNANNDSVTVTSSGVFSVDVNLGGACRDTFGSVNVVVSSINAVIQSVSPSICPGNNMQLYTSLPFANYYWSIGANSPTITVNQQGTYTVTVADGTGCLDTASITITEYPQPTAPTVFVGVDCQLASSVIVSGYSYKWRLNGNIVGGNSAYLDASLYGSGFYTIEITDLNGCKVTSSTPVSVDVTPCISGFKESTVVTDVQLYPNPNRGVFTIELKSPDVKQIQIYCLNSIGEIVIEKYAELTNGEVKTELNLSSKAEGFYFVSVMAPGKSTFRKLFIME